MEPKRRQFQRAYIGTAGLNDGVVVALRGPLRSLPQAVILEQGAKSIHINVRSVRRPADHQGDPIHSAPMQTREQASSRCSWL